MNDYQKLLELHETHKEQVEILIEREVNKRVYEIRSALTEEYTRKKSNSFFPLSFKETAVVVVGGLLVGTGWTAAMAWVAKLING